MLELSSFFRTLHFPLIDSTQLYAETHIDDLVENEWRAIIADQQLKGQGTHGRPWLSPVGNLSATFSIKIPSEKIPFKNLTKIPQLVAICIMQVLKEFGLDPQYKWVNDIFLKEKKVAGILCSSRSDNNGNTIIHIGTGINVTLSAKECSEISQPTTSLNLELGSAISVTLVLDKLKKSLDEHFNYFLNYGLLLFQEELNNRLAFKNTSIIFELHNKNQDIIEGVLHGIDENGFIIIDRIDTGQREKFVTGRILKEKTTK